MTIMRVPVIEVTGLTKTVAAADHELTIVDQVSFTVLQGETLSIVGASGSGKSTLLGMLAGLDLPSSGSVRLFGADLGALTEDGRAAVRAERVGFVFQSFQLMPHLSALENVMLPLEIAGRAVGAPARAAALLERVGLAARRHSYPKVLSGGEQQRVALARAFVTEPQLLFADEPTGSLDAANGQAITDLMFELNRDSGATLVLVTHDLELARRCDSCITLDAGRVAACSTLATPVSGAAGRGRVR
jgi:putative ABC transport system ATP-binding protein